MRKIISLSLALCLILGAFATPVFADTGYGESYGNVEDTLDDASVEESVTVAFNDFENVTGYVEQSGFKIADTGDETHGKALSVPNAGWGVSSKSGTYTYKDKTFTMFREPLTKGQTYILEYDYMSEKQDKTSKDYPFSFSPEYQQFWDGSDYRDYPPVHADGNWYSYAVAFTAEKDNIDLKLNSAATYIASYIDNLRIRKAITVTANGAVLNKILQLKTGTPIGNSKAQGMVFPAGSDFSFTLDLGGMNATVMTGGCEIKPDASGVYHVNGTLNDVVITAELNMDSFKKRFPIVDETVYLPAGTSVNFLTSTLSLSSSDMFAAMRGETALQKDYVLKAGDAFMITKLGTGDSNSYTVKILGDFDGDGNVTVTDLVKTVALSLKGAAADQNISQDVNADGRITVTDIVRIRKMILSESTSITPDDAVISAIDSSISEAIQKSGVTVTDKNLEQSIFNIGDRTRVANVIKKAMRGEKIVISTFGGSITEGSGRGTAPSNITSGYESGDIRCYADVFADWFRDAFKSYGATVELRNAGIGATDTPYGIHRMGEDVLAYNPDLVILEWDMNDQPEDYRQGTYEFMIRKLLKEDIAVVMLSMAGSKNLGTQFMHEPLSKFYNVPYVSYRDAFKDESYFANLTNDTVHPNIVGHHLTAMLLSNFFGDVYKDIANIGSIASGVPDVYYNSDAACYTDNPYIAKLSDIEDGKVKGVRMISRGSFQKEASENGFGFRRYYGYTAKYAESYKPMVLEIDKCQTLFLQIMRSYGMRDAAFYLEINGEKVTDSSFTCSHSSGGDSSQIENQYHWATRRAFYKDGGEKVTVKIYPTNKNAQEYVKLFALLLS